MHIAKAQGSRLHVGKKNQQNAQFDIKNQRKRAKKQRFWHENAVKIRNNTFNSEHCLLLANIVRYCFTKKSGQPKPRFI